MWCDLGFVPNSRDNKAAANLKKKKTPTLRVAPVSAGRRRRGFKSAGPDAGGGGGARRPAADGDEDLVGGDAAAGHVHRVGVHELGEALQHLPIGLILDADDNNNIQNSRQQPLIIIK